MFNIEFLNIKEKSEYENIISKVLDKCFEVEHLPKDKLLVSVTLTNPENIKKINKEYRKINRPTDVLSFPMFEKEEIDEFVKSQKWEYTDILGDMVISIEQVENQSKEFGHSFERELSYMVVHSFYHDCVKILLKNAHIHKVCSAFCVRFCLVKI